MEAEEKNRKRKLELDWNKLLSRQAGDEEPPPPLVVIEAEPQPPPRKADVMDCGDDTSKDEYLEHLPDNKLEEMIQGQQRTLERCASKLPDKGQKIRDLLECLEEVKKRRALLRAKMDADGSWIRSRGSCQAQMLLLNADNDNPNLVGDEPWYLCPLH